MSRNAIDVEIRCTVKIRLNMRSATRFPFVHNACTFAQTHPKWTSSGVFHPDEGCQRNARRARTAERTSCRPENDFKLTFDQTAREASQSISSLPAYCLRFACFNTHFLRARMAKAHVYKSQTLYKISYSIIELHLPVLNFWGLHFLIETIDKN